MNEYKWNARDILYTPAFLAGVASFILFSVEEEEMISDLGCSILLQLTLHFFKSLFEVQLLSLSLSLFPPVRLRDLINI